MKDSNLLTSFKYYLESHQIMSFYLRDTQGTYFLQDQNGEKKYLVIRNQVQLEELSKIAAEDGASENVVLSLKQGKMIPFFDSKEYWQIPASEWNNYLYPATMISNEPKLFWATIR